MADIDHVADTSQPEMEQLKRQYFGSHPDDPLIFHRKQLAYRKHPFHALRDETVEASFNQDLLRLLTDWNYTVFTVTIDKLQLLEQYKVWRYNPYHYCLKILIERYVQCLERHHAIGDVLAEARSTNADTKLKASFEKLHREGTEFVIPSRIQARLTSKQLKVKPKVQNIAGLQLADLIAYPSYKLALAHRNHEVMQANFSMQIAKILADLKYDRVGGKVIGFGFKWLP